MPGYPWTEDEKQLLRELTSRGYGAVRIRCLDHFVSAPDGRTRSVDAIAQQIRRLKLANAEASVRSRRARQRPRPSPEVAQTLHHYLRLHGADIPIWHVCKKFNVSESWVRATLRKLGISRSWKGTAAHPLSKFKSWEFRRAVASRVKAWARRRRENLALQMKRRRLEVLAAHPGIGQRVCDQCHEIWPLTEEFFQSFPSAKKVYFLYACHICAPARRRDKNPTSESPRTRRLRIQLEARREQVLASQPETQTKNCRVCWKPWPLTREFWRSSPTKAGNLCFDPRCRLCQNARRREAAKARCARQKFGFALLQAYSEVASTNTGELRVVANAGGV